MKALSVNQLTKRYHDQDVVSTVTFTLEPGEIIAIKGETGAGKTTLLKLIGGLVVPTSGTIEIFDKPLIPGDKNHLLHLGFMSREQRVYERLTPREYLTFFQRLYGVSKERVYEVIHATGLLDRQEEKMSRFSESFVSRLLISRAIIHQPKVLLLDEPTAHLDLETMEIIRKLIIKLAEEGTAILFTTSSQEEAQALAQRVAKMHRGRVLAWEDTDVTPELKAGNEPMEVRRLRVEKIPAKGNDKIILIDPQELIYIESQEGTAMLHTASEDLPCPLTLTELEDRLKPFGFFRAHRSYIVNLQRVREVIPWTRNSYSLVLDDPGKTAIPLSKNNYTELEKIIGL